MLNILREQWLFANLKKYRFYKNNVYFLSYVVLAQGVKIEDKQIKVINNWLKQTSVRDI